MVALLRSFVIRTGFEPVTHSLEGCCSIQLSYRTSPFIRFQLGPEFESGCKGNAFFCICNIFFGIDRGESVMDATVFV